MPTDLLLVGALVRDHAARGVTRAAVAAPGRPAAGRVLEQRVLRPALAARPILPAMLAGPALLPVGLHDAAQVRRLVGHVLQVGL